MEKTLLHIIYQDDFDLATITEYIESVDRLYELVSIQKSNKVLPELSNAIYINENRIHVRPDWLDQRPAIVFPSEIPFNKSCFLGTVFGFLGNEEKYREYLTGISPVVHVFNLIQAITHADEADKPLEQILRRTQFAHPFENYAFNHNVAIALNYGHFSNDINPEAIEAHYKDALSLAFEPSYKALTLKYYATFLIDSGDSKAAIDLLDRHPFKSIEEYAKYSTERIWCQARFNQINSFDDETALVELKRRLWDTLQFFDKRGHKTIAAFLWMDTATIANLDSSYSEATGYISKAITYFKEEGQAELLAQAQLLRGRILHDWSQSGNPQFYRSALEAFQEALKIFKKEETPNVFADIHHHLGMIYAELPDENKKRSIWAALSATSFNEALEYYTKEIFPNEYGMICNNFANAYAKYPQGGRSDNFEKALNLYNEALNVRKASDHPHARVMTLLNYLDASWKVGNPDGLFNISRYNDMVEKTKEILSLTDDEDLIMETEKHMQMLDALKKEFEVVLSS